MDLIAIMQGRLVPPQEGRIQAFPKPDWRDEFEAAELARIDAIEWIYDLYGEDANPIATNKGIAEIAALSEQHGVAVKSVCADYFMDVPVLRADPGERIQLLERLIWLIGRCRMLNMERMVLPFVDANKIATPDDEAAAIEFINAALPAASEAGIELHLETALEPQPFAALLGKLAHPLVRANYDSGNSSSLGYDVAEEFRAYGARVGSVHIKDRIIGGSTVPLGSGDADLPELFRCLARIRYCGDFVLQVARSQTGEEIAWAKHNRKVVEDLQKATAH